MNCRRKSGSSPPVVLPVLASPVRRGSQSGLLLILQLGRIAATVEGSNLPLAHWFIV